MFRTCRRTTRRFARRLLKPAVAVALVVAQLVTAFGYPVVVRAGQSAGCGGGSCGCPMTGATDGCCCGPTHCAAPAPATIPEEPDPCPKCRVKKVQEHPPKPATCIVWVVGMKARQCHGDGSLGLFADIPAIAADGASIPFTDPKPNSFPRSRDQFPTSNSSVPIEPPPRCG